MRNNAATAHVHMIAAIRGAALGRAAEQQPCDAVIHRAHIFHHVRQRLTTGERKTRDSQTALTEPTPRMCQRFIGARAAVGKMRHLLGIEIENSSDTRAQAVTV